MTDLHKINDKILASRVLLIDESGKQIGEVDIQEALGIAENRGLDLVELNSNVKPPVCKILDYGRYKYQLSKKQHEAKKKQKQISIKEIKLRPKIEEHDFDFKLKHAIDFIKEGHKVKVTVQFRGREASHVEFGMAVLEKFMEKMSEYAVAESELQTQARFIAVVLVPLKNNEKKTKDQKSSS